MSKTPVKQPDPTGDDSEFRLRGTDFLKTIVNASPDAVTATDLEGRITFASDRAAQMLGVDDPRALVGLSAFDNIHPDDRPRAAENLQKTLEHDKIGEVRYLMVRRDGGTFIGELNAAVIPGEDGAPVGFIATVRDVSDRAKTEENLENRAAELARANEELARMNQELGRLHRSKDQFIAMISHELRTPLVTGLGYVDLLLAGRLGALPEKAISAMRVAQRNLQRLARLIEGVFDYHTLQTHPPRGETPAQTLDLASICRETLADLQVRTNVSPGAIILEIQEPLPQVLWDRDLLRRVLDNLLDNAVRHGGDNVKVTVSARVTAEGRVEVTVSDNGSGIAPHIFQQALEPFVKGESAEGGAGLGLSIVRQLLQAHGAELDLWSRPGEGTRASFRLQAASELPDSEAASDVPLPPAGPEAVTGHVLVVDDDLDGLDFVRLLLEDAGFAVTAVTSAEAALDRLSVCSPDVILLDLSLPGMDGDELCRRLKASAQTARLPICMFTARAEQTAKTRAARQACDAYLVKPISPDRLISQIRQLMQKNPS